MLVIIFEIKNARYALSCERVVEVIPLVELYPATDARPGLAGVFVYRGKLIPVIDLCAVIAGYPCPARLSSRIVIVRDRMAAGELTLGLLGEHVTQARHIAAEVAPRPAAGSLALVGGMTLSEGEPLQRIDENAIFASMASPLGAPLAVKVGANGEEDRAHTQT